MVIMSPFGGLFWHQGITIQCILTQFIEHCYIVFGQRPQHIDEVDGDYW